MTKILILSDDFPPYERGGAGVIAGIDARELAKIGYEVVVITTVQDASRAGSFIEDGVTIERLYTPPYHPRWRAYKSLNNHALVSRVRILIDAFKPDVVHAHNIHEFLSYGVFAIAKRSGARVFLTAHDVMSVHYGKLDRPRKIRIFEQLREYRFWYNPFRNSFIRRALKNVDHVFAVSNALKEALELNGLQNLSVLYNGIDPNMWKCTDEKIEKFAKKHHVEEKRVVLFGGRISGMKGGEILMNAIPGVVEEIPNAVLLIAGTETEYVRALKARALQAGISDHIQCTGWLSHEEMCAAYHAAHVVVVPSTYLDPLPTVVLEAMACSRPVIGSMNGGIPEIIEDAVTGLLVDRNDTSGLAEAITELLRNDQKSVKYGHAGAARLRVRFSIQTHMKKLLAWYTDEHELAA